MPITATMPAQIEREIVPAGNYIARCYSMVYLGTFKKEFQGKEKIKQTVQVGWELPTKIVEYEKDGEKKSFPMSIGREFTLSMSDKGNLRPMLETWRGRAFTDEEAQSFDVTKLLGVPCMLNIIHKISKTTKKPYPFVASIAPMPQGILAPDQINPTFELAAEDWDGPKMEELPKFHKDKIAESEEWKAKVAAGSAPVAAGVITEGIDEPITPENAQTIDLGAEKEIKIEDVPF